MDFNLGTILGLIEHSVTGLYRANMLADTDHLSPHQPTPNGGRGRDHNAATATPFAVRPIGFDEHAIVQQLDRQPRLAIDSHVQTVPGRFSRATAELANYERLRRLAKTVATASSAAKPAPHAGLGIRRAYGVTFDNACG